MISFRVGPLILKWVIEMTTRRISTASTETVRCGVAADDNGVPVNPTGYAVEFAFMASTDTPGLSDWSAGTWATTLIGTYVAEIIVGPDFGSPTVDAGDLYVWLRISVPDVESIVRACGVLIVE